MDEEGQVHRHGTMRLAMAMDEIAPLRDPRVQANEAYLALILFSEVITRLGSLSHVTVGMMEQFFAADIAYLQEFYRHINGYDELERKVVDCPHCGQPVEVETPLLGGA